MRRRSAAAVVRATTPRSSGSSSTQQRQDRQRGGMHQVSIMVSSSEPDAASPVGMQKSAVDFWYADSRWRFDLDGRRSIEADGQMFHHFPPMGGVVRDLDAHQGGVLRSWPYFDPAQLLGAFRLRIVEVVALHDRSCCARSRPKRSRGRFPGGCSTWVRATSSCGSTRRPGSCSGGRTGSTVISRPSSKSTSSRSMSRSIPRSSPS